MVPTSATAASAASPVARYTFESLTAAGVVAETTGRGLPLKVRATPGGAARLVPGKSGRAIAFPAPCAAGAKACARVILEAGDDPDLDPGTRPFSWGATIKATVAQVPGEANIIQKGVASAASQWKLQIGGKRKFASCVLSGVGSPKRYLAKAAVPILNGQWHSISCRRTATALAIFVDGAAKGSTPVPAALNVSNNKPLRLGGQSLGTASDQFGGSIDDAFVEVG